MLVVGCSVGEENAGNLPSASSTGGGSIPDFLMFYNFEKKNNLKISKISEKNETF